MFQVEIRELAIRFQLQIEVNVEITIEVQWRNIWEVNGEVAFGSTSVADECIDFSNEKRNISGWLQKKV